MDAMKVDWNKPQEDEFALCLMGAPSPYLTIAFPNNPPNDPEALDLDGLPPRELAYWKRRFVGFLKRLTFRDPRRLVLKSPTHSCRIPTLLELFPDAQFVHIVRNPYVVFPSTVNLWKSLYEVQGLQFPHLPRARGARLRDARPPLRAHRDGQETHPARATSTRSATRTSSPIPSTSCRSCTTPWAWAASRRTRPRLEDYLRANAGLPDQPLAAAERRTAGRDRPRAGPT